MPRPKSALAIVASGAVLAAAAGSFASAASPVPAHSTSFLAKLGMVSTVGSTVPANGDVNPYGVAVVRRSIGRLRAGEFLVSNFNDKANNQGTGTTIVQLSRSGRLTVFAHIARSALPGPCPGGVGLTTALAVLPGGYVVVGSLPTRDGKSATAHVGCLIELDSRGHPVGTIAGSKIQGPWDLAAVSRGNITTLFVSMVLPGGPAAGVHTVADSTVVRIRVRSSRGHAPAVLGEQVIADRIPWRVDPSALVIGPTGLALAHDGTLYVADTLDNRIAAVADAMTRNSPAHDGGTTVAMGSALKQPLGLTLAPNGDVLTVNAADGNAVETAPSGQQLTVRTLDTKTGAGSLFGLTVSRGRVFFVDDGDNTLKSLHR